MKTWKLFLDDIRNPAINSDGCLSDIYTVARSTEEAKNLCIIRGMPQYVSFDHDLGGNDTAMDFIKWMIEYDMDNNGCSIPNTFTFFVHSANPVGKQNIQSLLNNYLKYKKENYATNTNSNN